MQSLRAMWESLSGTIKFAFNLGVQIAKETWDTISDHGTNALARTVNAIGAAFKWLWGQITYGASKAWGGITAAWNFLSGRTQNYSESGPGNNGPSTGPAPGAPSPVFGQTPKQKAAAAKAKKAATDQLAKDQAELQKAINNVKLPGMTIAAGTDKDKSAAKLKRDQLQDQAKLYDKLAKAAEQSAKRQIDALKAVQDKLRDIFGGAQEELLSLGITNNPLEKMISRFEKMAGIGDKIASIAGGAISTANYYRQKSLGARESLDKTTGGDGADPAYALSVKAGKSGANTMLNSLVKEFNDKSPRKLGASCADVASNVLNSIGYNLKYSARAADLEKNAKAAGWVMVPLGTPGSLNVQSGRGFGARGGSNAHTTIGIGNGRVAGSSGYRYQEYDITRAKGHPRAWAPAGGSFLGKNNMSALMSAFGGDGDVLAGLDGTFSKIRALPAAWGKAVTDTNSTSQRFKVQTALASKELQDFLHVVLGAKFDGFVAQLRKGINALDSMVNTARANKVAVDALREAGAAARARGKDGDPFFALSERRRAGGDLAAADNPHYQAVAHSVLRGALDDLNQSNKDLIKSEKDKLAVVRIAKPALDDGVAGTYAYARATEIAGKQVEYWSQKNVIALLKQADALDSAGGRKQKGAAAARAASSSLGWFFGGLLGQGADGMEAQGKKLKAQAAQIRKELNAGANETVGAYTTGRDASADTDRVNALIAEKEALQNTSDRLKEKIDLVKSLGDNQSVLAEKTERLDYYYNELDSLQKDGWGAAAKDTAETLADTYAYNQQLEKTYQLQQRLAQQRLQTANYLNNNTAKQNIYNNTTSGSTDQELRLKLQDAGSELRNSFDSGAYNTENGGTDWAGYFGDLRDSIKKIKSDMSLDVSSNASTANLASANKLLDTQLQLQQKLLELNGQLTTEKQLQLEMDNEIAKRLGTANPVTAQELIDAERLKDILKQIAELDYVQALRDLDIQIRAMALPSGRAGGYKQEDALRIEELRKQFPDKSADDIGKILDKEKVLRAATDMKNDLQGVWDSIKDGFGSALEAAYDATGGLFGKISAAARSFVQSIGDMFRKLAIQILQNYVISKVMGLFGGKAGGVLGAIASAAGVGGGAVSGGGSDIGVPWSSGSRFSVPASSAAISTRTASTVTVVNITHTGDIRANDPAQYKTQIERIAEQKGGGDSRRTSAQSMSAVVEYGKRGQNAPPKI
jgi:hypothetical protein